MVLLRDSRDKPRESYTIGAARDSLEDQITKHLGSASVLDGGQRDHIILANGDSMLYLGVHASKCRDVHYIAFRQKNLRHLAIGKDATACRSSFEICTAMTPLPLPLENLFFFSDLSSPAR